MTQHFVHHEFASRSESSLPKKGRTLMSTLKVYMVTTSFPRWPY